MRDEIQTIERDGFYLINLDTSDGFGTHWTAFIASAKNVDHNGDNYYFDPLGMPPPEELMQAFPQTTYSITQIQNEQSILCGYYCCYFFYFMHRAVFVNGIDNIEWSFLTFLDEFTDDTLENKKKIESLLSLR